MEDQAKLIEAMDFAARKHRMQRRKDVHASPYINHPIALARLLRIEAGVTDVEVLCAALLHDTVEDTDTTPEELAAKFGRHIADIVAEVTDDKKLPKEVRKQLQVHHAPSLTAKAKLVKLADKTCNLRDMDVSPPAGWSLERRRGYFEWAKQVVDGLRGTHPKLERLFDEAHSLKP